MGSFGFVAHACHPLLGSGGAVIGTLSFGTRDRETFSDVDLSLMKAVADQVAVAMVRMRVEQAVRDSEMRLKELNESLEHRVAERTAEVRKQADLLRALATELSEVEQRERKRLSQILHDHIQQLLVAARFQLELAVRNTAGVDGRSHALHEVNSILKEAIEASRTLAVELSPPVLHEAGLIGALHWLASRLSEKQQFTVRLHCDGEAEPIEEETRLLLFECVRELLLNVAKHSGVSEAKVTLSRGGDGRVTLTVEDAGSGFDLESMRNRRTETTLGLFSIQQRLAHLGGHVDISAAPGAGTRVTLTAPAARVIPPSASGETAPRPAGRDAGQVACSDTRARVLIVDDHKIVREGLVRLLQLEGDIDIVGEASDGPEAIQKARSLEPDVVVMDVGLGSMSGIDATRAILAASPGIRVIGLSMHIDREMVNAMTEAGAVAYFTKGGPPEDLMNAIRAFARK
jgi:signal transduction histidine kinase/ActR/RegA family two-component response regulator